MSSKHRKKKSYKSTGDLESIKIIYNEKIKSYKDSVIEKSNLFKQKLSLLTESKSLGVGESTSYDNPYSNTDIMKDYYEKRSLDKGNNWKENANNFFNHINDNTDKSNAFINDSNEIVSGRLSTVDKYISSSNKKFANNKSNKLLNKIASKPYSKLVFEAQSIFQPSIDEIVKQNIENSAVKRKSSIIKNDINVDEDFTGTETFQTSQFSTEDDNSYYDEFDNVVNFTKNNSKYVDSYRNNLKNSKSSNTMKIKIALDNWTKSDESEDNDIDINDIDKIIDYREKGLNESNYFGEVGKINFYNQYRKLYKYYNKKQSINQKIEFRNFDFQPNISVVNYNESPSIEEMNLLSPRSRFITRFIHLFSGPPKPIIVRSSEISSDELNLSNMCIKDDYILLLSEIITELPKLTKINLKNNQLTNRSLTVFIQSIQNQRTITELDISENFIDKSITTSLLELLSDKNCPIKILKLADTNINDNELSILMKGIEINQSLIELDVGHNLVGSISERNVNTILKLKHNNHAQITDSSIANTLTKNTVLQKLNLCWNKIGPLTTIQLARAISSNNSLIDLNLSYNCIKDDGAIAIANAILSNKSLKYINLSYNSITNDGSFAIATALKSNAIVELLDMSGNAIGLLGGFGILSLLNYHSCNREYKLNMKDTIQRMIFEELYRMASLRRGCLFTSIVYITKDSKRQVIKLARPSNPAVHMGQSYGSWLSGKRRERHEYTSYTSNQWMNVVQQLYLINSDTGRIFEIPTDGLIIVKYRFVPRCSTPIECLNGTGLQRFIKLLITHRKSLNEILKVCQCLVLETYQLNEIISTAFDLTPNSIQHMRATMLQTSPPKRQNSDKVVLDKSNMIDVFVSLVICCRDTSNVDSLVKKYFHLNTEYNEIVNNLRSMYYICHNSFTGHYKLDLSIHYDRLAILRLVELNAEERGYIKRFHSLWSKKKGHGFTSQKGNRNNFRNEQFNNKSFQLDDNFCSFGLLDKAPGVVEFDYVSVSRPNQLVDAITDYELFSFLLSRNLMLYNNGINLIMNPYLYNVIPADNIDQFTDTSRNISSNVRRLSIEIDIADINAAASKVEKSNSRNQLVSPPSKQNVNMTSLKSLKFNEGIWLTSSVNISIGSIKSQILRLSHGNEILKQLSKDDLDLMQYELEQDYSIYYINDNVNRFVSRVNIRIHSDDIPLIQFNSGNDNRTDKIIKSTNPSVINTPVSSTSIDSSKSSKSKSNSTDSYDFVSKTQRSETIGSILEICSVCYKQNKVLSQRQQQENDKNESILEFVHTGSIPYPYYNSKQSLESQLSAIIKQPINTLSLAFSCKPTHERFQVRDDVIIIGTYIIKKLKLSTCYNQMDLIDEVKTILCDLFIGLNISVDDIAVTNSFSSNHDKDEFNDNKLSKCVTSHVLNHYVDVRIKKNLPFSSPTTSICPTLLISTRRNYNGSIHTDKSMALNKSRSFVSNKRSISSKKFNLDHDLDSFDESLILLWRWRFISESKDFVSNSSEFFMKGDILAKRLLRLRSLSGRIWLSCRQAKEIVLGYPPEVIDNVNFRELAIIALFSRIVDLENFNMVMDTMQQELQPPLYNRLGWLNAINMKTLGSRYLDLDFSIHDNREIADAIINLIVRGKGLYKLSNEKFRRNFSMPFIPGWQLTASWHAETYKGNLPPGLPKEGNFITSLVSNNEVLSPYQSKLVDLTQTKYSLLSVPIMSNDLDFHLLDNNINDYDDL